MTDVLLQFKYFNNFCLYIYISIVTYYKYTSVDGITIHSCITIRKLTQYKN